MTIITAGRPAHRTANRPMASVSELRAVANMTPEIYQALLPWVTVWPQEPEPLNIHTAPAMVLRSINDDKNLSPLSDADGESLVQYRERMAFEDVDDFWPIRHLAAKETKWAGSRSCWARNPPTSCCGPKWRLPSRNMRLYSVLQRSNRQVEALVRASASL